MPPGMLVCGAVTDAENHLDQAIRACDEALSLDGDCVKALLRADANPNVQNAKNNIFLKRGHSTPFFLRWGLLQWQAAVATAPRQPLRLPPRPPP